MAAWWTGPSAAPDAMALVIFGIGNPSRGDDALGPLLMAELAGQTLPGVTLVDDFQLQVEHALDLEGQDLALFIDAGTGTPAPFCFREIFPVTDRFGSSHALAPEAVLAVHRDISPTPPPPAFVLCICGETFELGAPLSETARTHLAAARRFLGQRLAHIDAGDWRATFQPE